MLVLRVLKEFKVLQVLRDMRVRRVLVLLVHRVHRVFKVRLDFRGILVGMGYRELLGLDCRGQWELLVLLEAKVFRVFGVFKEIGDFKV